VAIVEAAIPVDNARGSLDMREACGGVAILAPAEGLGLGIGDFPVPNATVASTVSTISMCIAYIIANSVAYSLAYSPAYCIAYRTAYSIAYSIAYSNF
jgi:hypothetical protein